MHRFPIATCRMHLHMTPLGPWMVRGQVEPELFIDHRGQPDRRDVLRPLLDAAGHPVLPASSLKGVLRGTAERILRSMQPQRDPALPPLADEPFVHSLDELYHLASQRKAEADATEDSAEKRRILLAALARAMVCDSELLEWMEARRLPLPAPDAVYSLLSPASQLFGATTHAGLLRLDDAQAPAPPTWRRSHVAIDRFTSGVGEGPFIEQLVPSDITLTTTLTIENFALWHIGLLALVFQEINRGYVAIGGGTRKGQGQVRIDVPRVELHYTRAAYNVPAGAISAQARLRDAPWSAGDVPDAVYDAEHSLVLLPDLEPQSEGDWRALGIMLVAQEDQVQRLFKEAVGTAWRAWVARVAQESGA